VGDDATVSSSNEIRPPADPGTDTSWLRAVAVDAALFDRSSSAERVADVLRRRITEGDLRPGTQLSEELLKEALQVSRNTLREAFRLLTHEGLLVHRMHRGVFVPDLTEADLVDLYRLRRVLECDVVRSLVDLPADRLEALREDVAAGEAAAQAGDWVAVGTANMRFHRHLVGLAGSSRMDEITGRLLAELRLLFHVIATPQALHEPYIARNRSLLELLEAGRYGQAADELHHYMLDSEAALLAAFRARP
jgi:DNA-binding GntR family transcriptional regulator